MAEMRVGTCSWTDKTLLESKTFYPPALKSAEDRLKFYARHFDTVEVDSTFYALPARRNAELWAERTPSDFVFHIKAFGLLTQHAVEVARLPRPLKEMLRPEKRELRLLKNPPSEIRDLAFQMFADALIPLKESGKLGVILFQFPPFFVPRPESLNYLEQCQKMLPHYPLAIEFRHRRWVDEQHLKETLSFLKERNLAFVCVDEPQFDGSTMPPIAETTSDISYIRFHGRNKESWFKKGISTAERFKYLYSQEELFEWLPKIDQVARRSRKTFIMFNNCYQDYAIRNAGQLAHMVRDLEHYLKRREPRVQTTQTRGRMW